ncbi:unnamed protein product [Ilex paraguariensis]|uniref:UDP-glycosyltransferase n=1 Tax=Ilex paraguariensis TaxID=185542 RepID=A0ABC8T0B0_9AQUA
MADENLVFTYENYLTDGTLDLPIDFIPGMRDIRLKDLPSFIRTTDPNDIMFNFMGEEAQDCLNTSAIIFNTFDAFEHEVLEAFVSKFNYRNIYTIGPLPLLDRHVPESEVKSLDSSLWKLDPHCLEWLSQRELHSVLYVNYGSATTMSQHHFIEFAWELANSKQPFLWIVRPDLVLGKSAILPEEFLEETKDRGLLASWCAQDEVLK